MALAVAAGIEALKDAGIPLVMQYKEASAGGGKMIPDGFALPLEMQDENRCDHHLPVAQQRNPAR